MSTTPATKPPTSAMGDVMKQILGDAREAMVHGAGVGAAAEARNFCLEILHGLLPKDVPDFVMRHPLVKRIEPVVASLLVMFLSVFFHAWLPYSDKAYWAAKTALEADGRDIVQPMLARVAAMFRERLAEFVIPESKPNGGSGEG